MTGTLIVDLFHWIFGGALAAIWLSRVIDARLGMPTIADISEPEWDRSPVPVSKVTIIVPARNEAEHIGVGLRSLLALDYPQFEVLAVNDRSTDSTGVIMDNLARTAGSRLRVLHIQQLPAGWLGKTHAMWAAAQQATGDWILFTDADVIFRPDTLRRTMNYVEESGTDHLVLYPTIEMHTFGERMMINFFIIMFTFGHRAWKVADPRARDHVGVGAFNMVRRTTYIAIGTHEKLRLNVIDDINLGRLVKERGFPQRNVFGKGLIRLRWAKGTTGVIANLRKNFFALMRYNVAISFVASIAILLVNIGPFLGIVVAPGWTKLAYVIAVLSIFLLYIGATKYSGVYPVYFVAHPFASLLFVYTLFGSTASVLWHRGVIWRGTKYPLEDLRRNL